MNDVDFAEMMNSLSGILTKFELTKDGKDFGLKGEDGGVRMLFKQKDENDEMTVLTCIDNFGFDECFEVGVDYYGIPREDDKGRYWTVQDMAGVMRTVSGFHFKMKELD